MASVVTAGDGSTGVGSGTVISVSADRSGTSAGGGGTAIVVSRTATIRSDVNAFGVNRVAGLRGERPRGRRGGRIARRNGGAASDGQRQLDMIDSRRVMRQSRKTDCVHILLRERNEKGKFQGRQRLEHRKKLGQLARGRGQSGQKINCQCAACFHNAVPGEFEAHFLVPRMISRPMPRTIATAIETAIPSAIRCGRLCQFVRGTVHTGTNFGGGGSGFFSSSSQS